MYHILMDSQTGTYFMDPGELSFRIYTSSEYLDVRKKGTVLAVVDTEDIKELETKLYNAGFFHGYLNGEPYRLSKNKIYYYDRNPNEIVFAQYVLTRDPKYLELIKKNKLITLCHLENGSVYFPTAQISPDIKEKAVLAYTDERRMPQELLEKYDGWRKVKMSFDTRCLVNETFLAE